MLATTVAFWFQLVHVVEHVSLTSTWFLGGLPRGLSTLFGFSFDFPGAWAPGIRVWWHFVMNLVVTVAALFALLELRRTGLLAILDVRRRLTASPVERPEPNLD